MSKIAEECEEYRGLLQELSKKKTIPQLYRDWIEQVLGPWQVHNDEGIETNEDPRR